MEGSPYGIGLPSFINEVSRSPTKSSANLNKNNNYSTEKILKETKIPHLFMEPTKETAPFSMVFGENSLTEISSPYENPFNKMKKVVGTITNKLPNYLNYAKSEK